MSKNNDRFLETELWAMKEDRMIMIRADTFINIQKTIEEDYGEGADALLYECGIEAGRSSARVLLDEWEERDMDFLTKWSKFYGAEGVGWFEVESFKRQGKCVANLAITRSFIAEGYGKTNHAVCHFLAGFFVGVFWNSCGTHLSCEEIYCQAKGDRTCTFVFEPI